MPLDITSKVRLANGVDMPFLGLGTYKSTEGGDVERAVSVALEAGYRSLDTASMYENEMGIGRAVRGSGVPREEVFIATKAWNDEQGEKRVQRAVDESLKRLGLDYVDLYLVHWPIPRLMASTWRGMERILESGRVRAIGVCNFLEHHLERLAEVAEIAPMVNQVEHHPRLQQPGLRSYCQDQGIALEAWAPIMRGRVNDIAELVQIGERHGKSAVQVTLRWMLQHGVVVIPKSVHAVRIRENAELFDFELSVEEMEAIDALDMGEAGRFGKHPDEFEDGET